MGLLSTFLGSAAEQIKGSGSIISSFINQASQGDLNGALASLGSAGTTNVETLGAFGQAQPGDALRGMNARADAIQNWCWYCLMPSLTDSNAYGIFNGIKQTSSDITSGSPDALVSVSGVRTFLRPSIPLPWYYVQRANAPFRVIEAEAIKRNSHQVHLPISYNVPNLTLEFFMDSANISQKYLKAWASLILDTGPVANVSNQGVWGLPASYKKNIYIYVLSVTKKQLLNFKYINCWPADPQALELVSTDSAALTQTVNFMVEDVEVSVLNDKGLVDNLIETGRGYGLAQLSGFLSNFTN